MAKYRKKPLVIEAEQFFPDKARPEGVRVREGVPPLGIPSYYIETLEGIHEVTPGDWIITGIKGEKYPCKPDIFEASYEKVDD